MLLSLTSGDSITVDTDGGDDVDVSAVFGCGSGSLFLSDILALHSTIRKSY